MDTVATLGLLFLTFVIGWFIGQWCFWRVLGIPTDKTSRETEDWLDYLQECVEDRKADLAKRYSWFD